MGSNPTAHELAEAGDTEGNTPWHLRAVPQRL